MFVPTLYKKGAIDENMFSMFIDQVNGSKMQIGGYDLEKYASGPINWYNMSDPVFWMLTMDKDSMTIGEKKFQPSTVRFMADTGTSLNMIPDQDFNAIKQEFFANENCYVVPNTLTVCDCTKESHEKIPDIKWTMGGVEYVMPRDMWYERKDSQCVIKFMHAPGRREWILGVNWFTNYYAVFDYAGARVGLAPSINFLKPGSRNFINWALSGTNLLNLVANYIPEFTLSTKIIFSAVFGAWAMFLVYFIVIKKNSGQPKKVKARVYKDEEGESEAVVEYNKIEL